MTYLILMIVICSVIQFVFTKHRWSKNNISIAYDVFYALVMIYVTVIVGFALLYYIFSFYDVILYESYYKEHETSLSVWWQSLYFSGVTMLTIGYGDIIPLGVGRFFALLQALIGFVLPTAFVLKVVQLNYEEKRE